MEERLLTLTLPDNSTIIWEFQDEYTQSLLKFILRGFAQPRAVATESPCAVRVKVRTKDRKLELSDMNWGSDSAVTFNIFHATGFVGDNEVEMLVPEIGTDKLRSMLYQMMRSIWSGFLPLVLKRRQIALHGALLAQGDRGVIVCGPPGVGKSTCASRVPPPWTALADDAILITRHNGEYFAQGLPTWSRYQTDTIQPWLNWDRAVKLTGIFRLIQDSEDFVADIPGLEKISVPLNQFDDIKFMWPACSSQLVAAALDFASQLAHNVPVQKLHCSLGGEFWRELERFVK